MTATMAAARPSRNRRGRTDTGRDAGWPIAGSASPTMRRRPRSAHNGAPLYRPRWAKEGRGMTVPGSPTVRRRRLAAELRGIRESKGQSGDAVAGALGWSPSKISRYERAKTGLPPAEVERLLDYYEITGSRRELLLALAQDAAQKGWWEEFDDSLSDDYQQ